MRRYIRRTGQRKNSITDEEYTTDPNDDGTYIHGRSDSDCLYMDTVYMRRNIQTGIPVIIIRSIGPGPS